MLRFAWLSFREQLYAAVHEAGYTELQSAHVLLFRYPTIEGMRPGELAEQSNLSKQAVNDLLRQLEAWGYLTLEPDRRDRRAKRIALTSRGQALMDAMFDAAHEVAAEWADRVGRDRFDAFRATLADLNQLDGIQEGAARPLPES